jgi:hypothetical protein
VSFEYRLLAGSQTIDATNGLFSVDDFSFTPDGNCTEATFRLVPRSTTSPILPRTPLQIQVKNSSGVFINRWVGYITLAGNPRSYNVETYRAVGLKQLLYDIYLTKTYVFPSADVATQADSVLTGALESAVSLVGFSFLTRDVPTLSFTNGVLYPLVGLAGEILDNLASTVGQFIVPTATTYTYDSVTYAAGDVVPKVTWGIRATPTSATPTFFFRRTFDNVGAFAETELDVDVEWPAISGEEQVTEPVLLYYPNMDWSKLESPRETGAFARPFTIPVAQPMLYKANSLSQAQRVFQIPNPDDYLLELTLFGAAPSQIGTFSSLNQAFDGDSATAATGANGNGFEYFVFSNFATSQSQSITPGQTVARLDIEYGDTIGAFIEVGHRTSTPGPTRIWRARYTLPPLDTTGRVTFDFPILPPVEFLADTAANVFWETLVQVIAIPGPNGSGGTLSVFDARPFAPTTSASFALADSLVAMFRIPVPAEVSNVKVFDDEPILTQVDLTPEVGSVINVPVDRIQYSITTAEGITTTYHAGQAFDGELVSERVVLEGLARRAVRS